MIAPYGRGEEDDLVVAIGEMFGGYPSLRHSEEESAGRLDAVLRMLREFPAWAIAKACEKIRINGVWRDGRFDRKWPPTDAELMDAVRTERRLYGDRHDSAVALLAAKAEK